MFWKWKRKNEVGGSDAPLFEVKRERRATYRVSPALDQPVVLHLRSQELRVENISAGGLAIGSDCIALTSVAPAVLHLPDGEPDAEVQVEVVRTSDENRKHCRFVALDSDTEDRIHRYVLEREKEIIRKGKTS